MIQEPPKAGVIREGQTMWMGGGGGTYWLVDRIHNTVAVSFSQSFGGGHSTDAAKDESAIDGILVKMLKRNELTPKHHQTPTERDERD